MTEVAIQFDLLTATVIYAIVLNLIFLARLWQSEASSTETDFNLTVLLAYAWPLAPLILLIYWHQCRKAKEYQGPSAGKGHATPNAQFHQTKDL